MVKKAGRVGGTFGKKNWEEESFGQVTIRHMGHGHHHAFLPFGQGLLP